MSATLGPEHEVIRLKYSAPLKQEPSKRRRDYRKRFILGGLLFRRRELRPPRVDVDVTQLDLQHFTPSQSEVQSSKEATAHHLSYAAIRPAMRAPYLIPRHLADGRTTHAEAMRQIRSR